MKFRKTMIGLASASLLAASGAVIAGGHEGGHDHAHAMEFDEAAWYEMTGPNEHHERLHYHVGDWKATMKMTMTQGMSPESGEFDASVKLVMGGRFIEEHVTSDTPGGPFEGRGLMGYDNNKQRYVSTWFDNMGTTIYTSEGYWDEGAKTFEFHGKSPDMMTGETKKVRVIMERHSDDVFTVREWVYENNGTRWLRFDAEYHRQ